MNEHHRETCFLLRFWSNYSIYQQGLKSKANQPDLEQFLTCCWSIMGGYLQVLNISCGCETVLIVLANTTSIIRSQIFTQTWTFVLARLFLLLSEWLVFKFYSVSHVKDKAYSLLSVKHFPAWSESHVKHWTGVQTPGSRGSLVICSVRESQSVLAQQKVMIPNKNKVHNVQLAL